MRLAREPHPTKYDPGRGRISCHRQSSFHVRTLRVRRIQGWDPTYSYLNPSGLEMVSTRLPVLPSYSLPVLQFSRPTVFPSYSLPVLQSSRLIVFPSYSLPVLKSSRLKVFQSYSLPVLPSSRPMRRRGKLRRSRRSPRQGPRSIPR